MPYLSQLVRIQSAYLPGYNIALASSIRDGPLRSLAPQFTALGRHSRKTNGSVLAIWVSLNFNTKCKYFDGDTSNYSDTPTQGTADRVVPYRYAARVQAYIPHAELITIEDGPHDIAVSHPDQVCTALLEFLGR